MGTPRRQDPEIGVSLGSWASKVPNQVGSLAGTGHVLVNAGHRAGFVWKWGISLIFTGAFSTKVFE